MHRLQRRNTVHVNWGQGSTLGRRVALTLDQQRRDGGAFIPNAGAVFPGKGAQVIQPIGKRVAPKRQVAFRIVSVLKLRRPED